MRQATLQVTLTEDWGGLHLSSAVKIDGPLFEAFEPIDHVDEPLLTLLSSKHKLAPEVRIITKRREGFAKDLADRLAAQILKMMESRDTKNGYAAEPSIPE